MVVVCDQRQMLSARREIVDDHFWYRFLHQTNPCADVTRSEVFVSVLVVREC